MRIVYIAILLHSVLYACNSQDDSMVENKMGGDSVVEDMMEGGIKEMQPNATAAMARVTNVSFTGGENNYNFSVTISSPDTGCNQYADWWEVISEDGKLIYRRILAHSHVNEQPFTRSGGKVAINEDSAVIVRAHMNNTGYGTKVFKGSVATGFKEATIEKDFAADLENTTPLPQSCAF
ncbi:hypothetical protein [Aquimarina agarilytica]|uniref:hypothetical protein n=1 Tax=Aquimarina agarilytica TaxID=1087449 RepID=UPI000287ADEF|nr:hypothetical protein [Aquimarina agarilytica]